MSVPERETTGVKRSFRQTLIRVIAIQVITLLLLWLLQARYGS